MIHSNQILPPISRRAAVHLNSGGYAAYAKNYLDNDKEVPLTEEEWNANQETAATTQANAHMAYRPSTTQTIAENDAPMVSPQLIERYENEYASANDELAELAADGKGPGDPAYDKVLKKRDERKATLDQYNQQQALHEQTETAQDIVSSDESVEASNLRNAHNVAVTTGDADLEAATIAKANEAGINLFGTGRQTLSDQSASGDYGFRATDVGVDVAKNEVLDKRAEDIVAQMGSGTKYGQNTAEVTAAEAEEAAKAADEADKAKTKNWLKSTGLSDYFNSDQLANFMVQYLGSRVLGYDHGASAQFALKQVDAKAKSAQKSRAADQDQIEKQAFELLKEGKITTDQYNTMIATGQIPSGLGPSGIDAILVEKGINPDKATVKFVRTSGDNVGEIVETYTGSGGQYYWDEAAGELKLLDTTGYEKYSVESHSIENVQSNARTHMNQFVEGGNFKVKIGENEDGTPRFGYAVNPTQFTTAYTNWLIDTYGANGYVYANTPQGRAQMESMYTAAYNWSAKTGKSIENFPGFFSALNTGIYGADGHANRNVDMLYKTPDGKDVGLEHYVGLDTALTGFQDRHNVPTTGAAMSAALNSWENPQSAGERELKQQILANFEAGKYPAGTTPALEYVKIFLTK